MMPSPSQRKILRLRISCAHDFDEPALEELHQKALGSVANILTVMESPFAGDFTRDTLRNERERLAQEYWAGNLLHDLDPMSLKQLHRDSRWMVSPDGNAIEDDSVEVKAGMVVLSALSFLEAMLGPHDCLHIEWGDKP